MGKTLKIHCAYSGIQTPNLLVTWSCWAHLAQCMAHHLVLIEHLRCHGCLCLSLCLSPCLSPVCMHLIWYCMSCIPFSLFFVSVPLSAPFLNSIVCLTAGAISALPCQGGLFPYLSVCVCLLGSPSPCLITLVLNSNTMHVLCFCFVWAQFSLTRMPMMPTPAWHIPHITYHACPMCNTHLC